MASTTRVRLRFAKTGDLRLVSHHDLMRCLERALRRAEIPVATSQGFNPRPKVVFALAMALGIEGRREVLDLDLAEPMEAAEVHRRLARVAPPGLEFAEAEAIPNGKAARVEAAVYSPAVPGARRESARAAIGAFLEKGSVPHTRHRPDKKPAEIDLRPFVAGASVDDAGELHLRLLMAQGGTSARPEEVVDALGLRDLLDAGAILARTDVELASNTKESSAAPRDPEANGPAEDADEPGAAGEGADLGQSQPTHSAERPIA